MVHRSSFIGVAILLFAQTANGQSAALDNRPTDMAVGLLRRAGPGWDSASSQHFLVYVERGERPRYQIRALIDSLETAWHDGVALLESGVPDFPKVTVLVTRSRHRFGPMMSPTNKGMTINSESDAETILLVHNDTVRLYARHEVMHALSRRAWGVSQHLWVIEGIAVVADGACLGSTSMALARDVLRAKPELTAGAFARTFSALVREDRAGTYALAGSLVSFLLARGGIPLVRQAWALGPAVLDLPAVSDPSQTDWRTYVERATVGQPSLPPDSLARFGCG